MSAEKKEFHVFVTSNRSNTHIIVDDSEKTLCGIEDEAIEKTSCRFPESEIRATYTKEEFKKWADDNRYSVDDGWRFCKRCLKAYDKIITS